MKKTVMLLAAVGLLVMGCRKQAEAPVAPREDATAKQMLQGIWLNDGEEDVAFKAKGDTIYYPDSTSLPVYFQIVGDTLVLHGVSDAKYRVLKQAPHLFVFEHQSGDHVRLVNSEDAGDEAYFGAKQAVVLNQRQLIKRDTVVTVGNDRYHCYVQVNPTTYKVVKTAYNDDGVAVDNVYYDNIVHLSVFKGNQKVYSSNFEKKDFAQQVPSQILTQSVLSDITYTKADASALYFTASIAIPDSPSCYQVVITIAYDGKMTMQVF